MRIIFFNIWHGSIWKELKEFIKKQSDKTDIFCFLEVNPDLQNELQRILTDFSPIYKKGIKVNYLNGIIEGRAIFVKKELKIEEQGTLSLYRTTPIDAGGLVYVKLKIDKENLLVCAVHGKARPGTKIDTPIRIKQSEKILDFCTKYSCPKIIGGDFNLNPDTKSIKMFEESGYRNLIKESNIKSTRNNVSWSNFSKDPDFVKQYFADYVFVSPEVKVESFEVPYNEVSDHLPLILDFEL